MTAFRNTSSPWIEAFPVLLLGFGLLLSPVPVRATGFEEPARWIAQGAKPVLDAPEFFFELELKRLAAELQTREKAIAPKDKDYGGQSSRADLAEFEEALKQGAIKPPEIEKARAAHAAVRAVLNFEARENSDASADSDAKPADAKPPVQPSDAEPAHIGAALAREFTSEFADYHRGAVAFHAEDYDEARKAWAALLARPAAERHYRTTWAAFMLGKIAIEEKDWDAARKWFAKTREDARGGFADSIGLASSSLGWEGLAALDTGKLSDAARLYLAQLGTGDTTAVDSLRAVLDLAVGKENDYTALLADPTLLRLGTAAAISGFLSSEDNQKDPSKGWLAVIEKADLKEVADADRLAWIAYQDGDFARAERWLKRADPKNPYVLWLQAKLALRAGKMDRAAELLAQALPHLPQAVDLESRYLGGDESMPIQAARADLGSIQIGRSDFVSALKVLVGAGELHDAEYVAEALLTVPELKELVDRGYPPKPKRKPAAGAADDNAPAADGDGTDEIPREGDVTSTLRQALGRRLLRAGRTADARPYFSEEEQAAIDKYAVLLDAAKKPGLKKPQKAGVLWKTAKFLQSNGNALLDYYDPEIMAERLTGHLVTPMESPVIALKVLKDKADFTPPVTAQERDRLKKNNPGAFHHYQSIYTAADLAWQAAALLPDNNDLTVEILNTAGCWLKVQDDDAADRFYQAIERRCPKTELGRQAVKKHWFVPLPEPDPAPAPAAQ